MNEYLLKTLLTEYLRQLQTALDAAQTELQQQMEPERRRAWKGNVVFFHEPTEDTPPEHWKWVEEYPRHPALVEMEQTIKRIEAFVEGLGSTPNATG